MKKVIGTIVCASMCVSPALAGTAMIPQPFQVGAETGEFQRGVPTVTLEQKNGAVEITPLPLDHGCVSFMVVVYNDGTAPADFDAVNVHGEAGGQQIASFTEDQLEHIAKTRAMWAQIATAVIAGAAAAAVASAHTTDRYYGNLRTPHGTYSWVSSYRDNSIGVVGATASVAAGAAGINSIQGRLNATLGMLSDQVVQRTTVAPGASYGGRVILQKIKAKGNPQDVRIAINWNGETYPFGLHIPKKGDKPTPPVRPAEGPPRDARALPAPPPPPDAAPPVPAVPASPTT